MMICRARLLFTTRLGSAKVIREAKKKLSFDHSITLTEFQSTKNLQLLFCGISKFTSSVQMGKWICIGSVAPHKRTWMLWWYSSRACTWFPSLCVYTRAAHLRSIRIFAWGDVFYWGTAVWGLNIYIQYHIPSPVRRVTPKKRISSRLRRLGLNPPKIDKKFPGNYVAVEDRYHIYQIDYLQRRFSSSVSLTILQREILSATPVTGPKLNWSRKISKIGRKDLLEELKKEREDLIKVRTELANAGRRHIKQNQAFQLQITKLVKEVEVHHQIVSPFPTLHSSGTFITAAPVTISSRPDSWLSTLLSTQTHGSWLKRETKRRKEHKEKQHAS